MKTFLQYKAPLFIVLGILTAVLAAIINGLVLAVIAGVLTTTGICFVRTVNPDIPPPLPDKQEDKERNLIIVIVLILAYLFNSNLAEYLYPDAASDYDQWKKYYNLRNQIYAVMFFVSFLYVFFNSRLWVKSLAAFALFVTFGSVIDKVFYNFYQFKYTDWFIIFAGAVAAIYVYRHGRKNRRI